MDPAFKAIVCNAVAEKLRRLAERIAAGEMIGFNVSWTLSGGHADLNGVLMVDLPMGGEFLKGDSDHGN